MLEEMSVQSTSNWSDFYVLPFINRNKSGFVLCSYFPTLVQTHSYSCSLTGAAAPPPPYICTLFFISELKYPPNQFWDMLRINSNRLFFLPPSSFGLQRAEYTSFFSLFSSHRPSFQKNKKKTNHADFRLCTRAHWRQCVRIFIVMQCPARKWT